MSDNRAWFRILCLLATLGLTACEEEPVRVYSAPPDLPHAPPVSQREQAMAPMPTGGAADSDVPHWTLPPTWEARPASGMRHATILVGPADTRMELTVIALPAEANPVPPNVNRWRGEIGLEPVGDEDIARYVRSLPGGALLVDLTTEPTAGEGTLAAMVRRAGQMWFFKLRGPREAVAVERERFEQFMRTVHFHASHQEMLRAHGQEPPPASSTPPATAAQPTALQYDTPPAWQPQEGSNDMRAAAFWVTHGDQRAEVTVTHFPGDVGSTLDNINRWRAQIDLPPIGNVADQPGVMVDSPAGSMTLLDLSGPEERMLVTAVSHAGRRWFFKMVGPEPVVAPERDNFIAFLSTVRFTEGTQ